MLEQNFQSVYEKFKLQFFRRLFSQVREREGSLSAMEAFSVEVIHELDAPTIGQNGHEGRRPPGRRDRRDRPERGGEAAE